MKWTRAKKVYKRDHCQGLSQGAILWKNNLELLKMLSSFQAMDQLDDIFVRSYVTLPPGLFSVQSCRWPLLEGGFEEAYASLGKIWNTATSQKGSTIGHSSEIFSRYLGGTMQ